MSELVDFLTQRLDEDEAVARASSRGPWVLDEDDTAVRAARGAGPSVCTTVPLGHERRRANATHIARHDPARVLREVTAKRAILARCVDLEHVADQPITDPLAAHYRAWLDAVRALAAPFSDHPDFQEQWR